MKKDLFDAIQEFCEYLTDWEEKKQDYINYILPDLKYGYSPKEIKNEARVIFNEKIRTLTNSDPTIWENIVKIIAEIKENPEEFKRTELGKTYKIFFDILKEKYNFQGFIHTTSFENFINIIKSGYIFSRNYITNHNIHAHDIALDDVINKTSEEIKDYVRFYWRVKTPTNYDNEGIKPKAALTNNFKAHSPNPVILIIDENIALNDTTRFTPINACKCSSLFTHSLCENKIKYPFKYNFENIFHNCSIREDEDKQAIIDSRNAEILYPNRVPINKIKKIIFRSHADFNRAIMEIGEMNNFEIDAHQFFNKWLYVEDYQIKNSKININLEIKYHFGQLFYKYNLLDFTHKISLFDEKYKKIKDIEINDLIKDPNSSTQNLCINNKSTYKYICYYIDDIECIKVKIND